MGTEKITGPFKLPSLPYNDNALAPYLSAQTLSFHYGKHHQTYVTKLNELVQPTVLESETLEGIIKQTAGQPDKAPIFNNAAQSWNHSFYWKCMKANGGGKPNGAVANKIESSFGGYDKFKEAFAKAALTQFGSGWAWLVSDKGALKVIKTQNADTPIVSGLTPVLTLDVWEHAYYLDYQNRRSDYIQAFLDHLANWDFANENISCAASSSCCQK